MQQDHRYRDGIPTPQERPYLIRLGCRIRAARAGRFSLRELEAPTGYSAGHLSRLERGLTRPRETTLRAIAGPLGIPVEELITLCGPALAPPKRTA